jgi:hypothetical protein
LDYLPRTPRGGFLPTHVISLVDACVPGCKRPKFLPTRLGPKTRPMFRILTATNALKGPSPTYRDHPFHYRTPFHLCFPFFKLPSIDCPARSQLASGLLTNWDNDPHTCGDPVRVESYRPTVRVYVIFKFFFFSGDMVAVTQC